MSTSRTVANIDQSEKALYPKCNLKKEHQKESLNMICLTKTCKNYGPICGLCKKQHSGHNVVSIKSFITSIEQTQKTFSFNKNKIEQKFQIEENTKKTPLQTLYDSYLESMSMLNIQVKQLSQQIQKTQTNLIKQFEQIKQALKDEAMKEQVIADNLSYLQNKRIDDGLEFRKSINTILKLVTINKGDVQISTKEDEITKNYQRKMQICKQNLIFISLQIKQLYGSLQDELMREKAQKVNDIIRPKTAIVGSIMRQQNQVFTRILKASNIIVEKEGKCARMKDNSGMKTIFLHNVISSKIFSTTFKILSQPVSITLGVGLKDKLKLKDYKFQKPSNKEFYGIASNGYKINHTQKSQDSTISGLTFGNGDQVTITLKVQEKKLLFTSKDPKKKAELNLKALSDKDFKQLQFCVILGSMSDKVQIL